MKRVLFFIMLLCATFTFFSCEKEEINVSLGALKVSKQEVVNGDNIKILLETGAEHNVSLNVTFYVDDTKVGTSNGAPYQIDYVVPTDMPEGIHMVSVEYTGKKSGSDLSGNIKNGTYFKVVKNRE